MLAGFFGLVIALCPPGFRREYGAAMRRDFAQAIASEYTLHGWFATVTYCCEVILDLLTTALREYAAMFFRDFTYAVRGLRKTPLFSAIVVLTMALAIGANATVFSILRTVVLEPLPYAQPDRLVSLTQTGDMSAVFSLSRYARIVRGTPQIADAAAFARMNSTLFGHGAPERLIGTVTTADFFRTLGVVPKLGRFPDAREVSPGSSRPIVISERLFRRVFASNPNAIGSIVRIDEAAYRLIGVVPGTFAQPMPNYGFEDDVDFWTFVPEDGKGTEYGADYGAFFVVGLLASSETAASLQSAIDTVTAQMRRRDPIRDSKLHVRVDSFTDSLVGRMRPLLFAMFAAVFAVLLVACANVANLLLSRAASRDREFSVRVAIGASRGRIVVQLLIETFALAFTGGAIGIGLAYGAVAAFVGSNPPNIPRATLVSVDGVAIAYTFCVVAFCTFAAGLAPGLTMAQRDIALALKSAGRGGDAHRGSRARSILAGSEIAVTLALVVGAGLVLRSFLTLTSQSLGFDPHGASILGIVDFTARRYAGDPNGRAAEEAFLTHSLERIQKVPGVTSASWGFGVPLGHGVFQTTVEIPGQRRNVAVPGQRLILGQDPVVTLSSVGATYFTTMRISLRAGRTFSSADRGSSAPIAIVNESFARRYFVGHSPVGAYIVPAMVGSNGAPARRRIVGVVADTRWSLRSAMEPEIYLPIGQLPLQFADLVIRAAPGTDPGPAVAAAIVATDPLLAKPSDVATMDAKLAGNVAVQRLTVTALCTLAFVALALSIAGVFAVVSYGVTQRTHEFGVRMALGADARGIVRMVVGNAMRLALFGIVAGLIVAGAGTRLLTDELFETQPLDPLTFTCVTILVLVAAFSAALVPARRATRVDPIVALRYE
jgi:putative ABC transport system permease protein